MPKGFDLGGELQTASSFCGQPSVDRAVAVKDRVVGQLAPMVRLVTAVIQNEGHEEVEVRSSVRLRIRW